MLTGMMLAFGIALASDEPPPPRDVNGGFGLGVAALGAGGHQRLGLHLELRNEVPLSKAFQFNFLFAAGLTTPENTVAMFQWGTGAGRSITHAFGGVHDWAHRGGDDSLREVGALFAYMGLGLSYLAVPVVWILSPVASVGHTILGPTVSWHTGPHAPNGYLEVGAGGVLYGDPIDGGPGVGFGPLVGAGAQIGKQTVGVRVLISPPAMHAETSPSADTVVSGAFVVTL